MADKVLKAFKTHIQHFRPGDEVADDVDLGALDRGHLRLRGFLAAGGGVVKPTAPPPLFGAQ